MRPPKRSRFLSKQAAQRRRRSASAAEEAPRNLVAGSSSRGIETLESALTAISLLHFSPEILITNYVSIDAVVKRVRIVLVALLQRYKLIVRSETISKRG